MTSFTTPGPSKIFVFLDEDADSLNDGGFAMGMVSAVWIDWPGTYHNFGAGFAFADGHSEIQKWRDPKTQVRNGNTGQLAVRGSPDWFWLRERTSIHLSGANPVPR
jgi:prepilin-type processing-associated H-X9-DG protein